MTGRRKDYNTSCADAATQQGLDPVVAALNAAGIAHGVEQTGGFCMAVTVKVPGGVLAIINDGGGEATPELLADFYPGGSWIGESNESPEPVLQQATCGELIAAIRDRLPWTVQF